MSSITDPLADAIAQRVIERLEERGIVIARHVPEEKEEPLYYTPREAARKVKKSDKTVYNAIHAGELAFMTSNGRYLIKPEDLKEWALQCVSHKSPTGHPR